MSSSEIKEELVDWYGGNIKDWKRISKKKKGCYDVRVFENKTLGLTKEIVSEEDDEDHIKPEYFPTGEYWIYLNRPIDLSNVDETKSYYDSSFRPLCGNDNLNPTIVLKDPLSDHAYDRHCSYLIQDYFGVKHFRQMFYENMENYNVLVQDIPISQIKNILNSAGMKFLGYRK